MKHKESKKKKKKKKKKEKKKTPKKNFSARAKGRQYSIKLNNLLL
jgi:hypothetical protein